MLKCAASAADVAICRTLRSSEALLDRVSFSRFCALRWSGRLLDTTSLPPRAFKSRAPSAVSHRLCQHRPLVRVAHYRSASATSLSVRPGPVSTPAADQPRALSMPMRTSGLVPEETAAALCLPASNGVRIVRRAAFLVAGRPPGGGGRPRTEPTWRRCRCPGLQHEPGRLQLPQHLLKQRLAQPGILQGIAKSPASSHPASPHPAQTRKTAGNDTRSSSASSSAGSDRSYICCRSSAFNIDIAA